MIYDPFDPENVKTNCPACQKRASRHKPLGPVDSTTRRCEKCGRVERWMKPDRKIHGDRRYKRFIADQRRKFGDMDAVLPRWIPDPETQTI